MCCNNRRAARCEVRSASRSNYMQQHLAQPRAANGITEIISVLQATRLAAHGTNSGTPAPQAISLSQKSELEKGLERGTAREYRLAADEKTHPQQYHEQPVFFEELPSYEESTDATSSVLPRLTTELPKDVLFKSTTPEVAAQYAPAPQRRVRRSTTQPSIDDDLETFRNSLLAYRTGVTGGKHDVKKAAKTLARDFYHQEVANRRGEKGYLECGERKSIRREVKPVKQMLKSVLKEARHERPGRH